MSETPPPPMTCASCDEPIGADVYIGPSGLFYCRHCRECARQSIPTPVERQGEE